MEQKDQQTQTEIKKEVKKGSCPFNNKVSDMLPDQLKDEFNGAVSLCNNLPQKMTDFKRQYIFNQYDTKQRMIGLLITTVGLVTITRRSFKYNNRQQFIELVQKQCNAPEVLRGKILKE